MRRGIGIVARLAAAVVVAAGILFVPGRTVPAAIARSPDCPSPPVTASTLLRVMERGDGLACYGNQLLTFRAFVPWPAFEGGTSAATISPRWLDDFEGSWVTLATAPRAGGPVAFVPPGLGRCVPWRAAATCPFRSYFGRWATVSAHFDGPVARTCRYPEHPSGPGFTRRDAVAECRRKLIVLAIGPAAPPATETGRIADTDRDDRDWSPILVATFGLVSLALTWRRGSHRMEARQRPGGDPPVAAGGADRARRQAP